MAQLVRFPNGKYYDVEGSSQEEVQAIFEKMLANMPAPEAPKPESKGILGRGAELFGSGVSELLGSTAEGIQTLGTITGVADPQADDTALLKFAERRRESARDIAPIKPLQEAEGIGDVVSSGLSYLTQSIPEMGVVLTSAAAGAKAGFMAAPLHPMAKVFGALGGGTVGGILPFLGRNTEEFKEVKGRNPEQGEAAGLMAVAGVQSGLNSVISAIAPFAKYTGTDKALKAKVGDSVSKVVKSLSTGSQNAFQNALKRGVQGTILEGSTEASQDILQILAANDFDTNVLKDPENVFRVTESLLAGAAIGGGIGGTIGLVRPERPEGQFDKDLLDNANKFVQENKGVLQLEDKREKKPDTKLLEQKEITKEGSDKKRPLYEFEPEIDDVELDNILKSTDKDKNEQIASLFLQRANELAIDEVSRTKAGNSLQKLGELKRTEAEQLSSEFQPRVQKNFMDLVNSKLRKSVVVSRNDKGKTSVMYLTNNELVRSAQKSSDPTIQEIVNSTVPTETKAIQIAKYLDRTAKPRVNFLGTQVDAKTGKRYKSKFIEFNTEQLKAQKGQILSFDERLLETNPNLYYVNERNPELSPFVYTDKDGKQQAFEPTLGEGEMDRTTPVDEVIKVAPKEKQETELKQTEKITPSESTKVAETIDNVDQARGSIKLNDDGTVNPEETQRADDIKSGAREYIYNKLNELSKRGKQGKLLADSIRFQVIKPLETRNVEKSPITGNQLAGVFMAADEIVNTLGEKSDVDVYFQNLIIADRKIAEKSGDSNKQYFKGLKEYSDDAGGKARKLIRLAFQDDKNVFNAEDIVRTAAHEAFHFLQDTYSVHDPKARSLLNGAFNLEKGYNKIPSSIRRLLRRNSPGLHQRLEKKEYKFAPTEFQAIVYDNYKKAKLRGEEAPLSGILGGYFDFLTRFLPRLRNALQGAGFRTVEDIIENAAEGGVATQFEQTDINQLKEAEREIAAEEDVQSTNKEESWGQGETAARGSIALEEAPIPQETVTGYKLFRQEPDGQLYPLFVDADNPIPMDKWYKANSNVFTFTAENGKKYVPARTGDSIKIPNNEVRKQLLKDGIIKKPTAQFVKAVAFRPGWHAGRIPEADHIKMRDNYVWAEVELANDDKSIQQQANDNAINEKGKFIQKNAQLETIPFGGFYEYKTNPNQKNTWMIGGDLKINRILTDKEVNGLRQQGGIETVQARGSIRLEEVEKLDLESTTLFPKNPEHDEIVQAFGLTEQERRLSGIDFLYPKGDKRKPDKPLTVKEIGRALQNLVDRYNSQITEPSVEGNRSIAKMMAALAYTVKQRDPKSAIDWYSKSMQEALEIVGDLYPEVNPNSDKYDRNHQAAFSVALSVSSLGQKVFRNGRVGLAIYEHWREFGKFPLYGEGDKGVDAMPIKFQFTNTVSDVLKENPIPLFEHTKDDKTFFTHRQVEEGIEGKPAIDPKTGQRKMMNVFDFFDVQFKVEDLKKFLREQGFSLTEAQAKADGKPLVTDPDTGKKKYLPDIKLDGENGDSLVYGSYLLGPKLGNGFYQNLMGNFDPITMDLWFMRTWGRMSGTLVGKPALEENLQDIVDTVEALRAGKEKITKKNKKGEDVEIDIRIETDLENANYIRNELDLDPFKKYLKGDKSEASEMYSSIAKIKSINDKWYKTGKEQGKDNKLLSSTRPYLFRRNNAAISNGLATIDSPRNGTDRKWMRSVVEQARSILRGDDAQIKPPTPLNLTSADFQAIIWYPEKDLYKGLSEGTLDEEQNIAFNDVFRRLIRDEEYKTIRQPTDQKGLFSVIPTDQTGKSTSRDAKGKDAKVRGSDTEDVTARGSIRLEESDLTSGMHKTLESPVDAQGLVPNNIQKIKFQVLKYLAPINIFNKRVREQFVDEFVNGLEPLARRERAVRKKLLELYPDRADEINKLPGSLLSYEKGAFKAVEMAQQMAGRVEMMAEKGAPVLQSDGSVLIDPNTKGLFEIFRPIGQSQDYLKFQMYVYAKRSQRLLAEGREALFEQKEINEGLGYENDTFRKVFSDYEKFNKAMMKFMVDTGSITQEQADKLTNTHDYIPFYRIQEEEVYEGGLFGQIKKPKRGIVGTTTAFDKPDLYIKNIMRELKGGEQKIGDLYTNVFANAQSILSAGMKNVAMQKTVRLIEQAKQLGLYDDVPKKPEFINKEQSKNNDNHFTYRENGVTKYYDVGNDQDLLTALRTFTPIQMQGILKFMQNISRMFRSLITITPGFMVANFLRGDMAGVVTVDAKLVPIIDSVKGLRNVFNDSETALEMKTIGGFGGYTFGEGSENFSKKMKKFYRRHEGYDIVDTPQRVADMMSTLVDKVNSVGETTELATREAIYRKLVEAKVSKADAAYEALNLINFNRRGNPQGAAAQTLGILLPLVPFLNARIQGLYRTGTALGGTESNYKATALKGMTLMGMSLGLYAIMSQDEDWEKEPLYRKLNYYIIYAGDKKFLIPKPFEVGAIFSTIPEVFLDGIRQRDGNYVKDAVVQLFLNNFEFNPIPQALSPILEVATNRDFFRGRELESLGQRGLPTAQRAYSTTSQFAQLMGEATATMGISPIEFEQLVNGYLGSMGSLVLAGMDSLLGMTGAVPKKPTGLFGDNVFSKAADSIGLTRFYKQRGMADPANRYLSEFYELKREADQLLRGINNMREQGNYEDAIETRKQNRSLLGARSTLNKMFNQINDINDKIQGVRNRDVDPNKKAEQIKNLLIRRNTIANRIKKIKERIRKAA